MRTHIHQAKDGTYEVVDADAYDKVLLKGFIWEEQAVTAEKQYLANLRRQGGNATSTSKKVNEQLKHIGNFAILKSPARDTTTPHIIAHKLTSSEASELINDFRLDELKSNGDVPEWLFKKILVLSNKSLLRQDNDK